MSALCRTHLGAERWLDVVGYEGLYQISNRGRLRIFGRWVSNQCGRYWRPEEICGPWGYRQKVVLKGAGLYRKVLVYHLVLEAFVGPKPDGMEACHFPDKDPGHNCAENLRWDTHAGNHQDRIIHGTSNAGEANGRAVLTDAKVYEVKALYRSGNYSRNLLAKMFRVCYGTVYYHTSDVRRPLRCK